MNANRNPEQIRLEKVHEERDRLSFEGYKLAHDSKPRRMDPEERREVVRAIIERTYTSKPAAWKEERLRQILGPQEAPAKKPAAAPIRKKSAPVPPEIRNRIHARNKEIAASFGIKEPGSISYR